MTGNWVLEWTELDIEIMTGGVKNVIYLFLFFGVHDNKVALKRIAPPVEPSYW